MRRFGKGILIGVLTAVMSLFGAIGCSGVELPINDKSLAAVPEDSISASLQGTSLTVEWGAVQNATSYFVTFDNATQIVYAPTTSAKFSDVEYVSGSLTITIVAQAPGYSGQVTTYTFTPGANTLDMPTGLAVSDGKLTWTAVKNAIGYAVSDGSKTVTVATNSIDLAANGLIVPSSSSVSYMVVAKASGFNDSPAAIYTYTPTVNPSDPSKTLAEPTGLAVSNGKLTWKAVPYATSYTVSDGSKTVPIATNSIDLESNGLKNPTSGSVTYMVVAKAPNYTDSPAAVYTYTVLKTLSTPTGLAVNNGKLTWTAVPYATSYTVSDGSKTVPIATNSIDLAANGLTVPTSGSITYTVVAKAPNYNDSLSASFTYTPTVEPPQPQTLSAPTGLAVSNGKLTWTAVAHATSYTVSDGTKTVTVTTNSIGLAANGLTVPTNGSVTYTVVAKASGYNDSAKATYTYVVTPPQTLAVPTGLAVSNGKLTWTAVAHATSYTVSDGTKTVTVTTNSIDLAANGLTVPTNGSVTYTVVAKATGYNDSAKATFNYSVTPKPTLATPTGLAFANNVLSWTAVSYATSYTVSDGTHSATVNTNSINLTVYGLTVPTSGSTTYTVVAKATGYNDSAAASLTYTPKPTLSAPTGLGIADGVLTWTAVANAASYTISDGTKTVTITTTGIDLAAQGFILPASGKATYTVIAKATGYNDSAAASYTHTFGATQLQTVTLGEYPQSLKDPSVTVSGNADTDGYFAGSDGARYAKVVAQPYVLYAGYKTYFSTGEEVKADEVYYFKVEPIKWRVLGTSGDGSLLFSDSIIDNGVYYNSESNRELSGGTVYPSNYEYSDLRAWLNGSFYSIAFDSTAKGIIKTTTVDNSATNASVTTNMYACEDTVDNIFLLGSNEINNIAYGFMSDSTESDTARLLIVSDYARAKGAFANDSALYPGCGIWWLRTPMHDSGSHVYCCTASGMVGSSKVSTACGIAPAMWVTTSAL